MSTKKSIALKIGQELIELGLLVQKKEIPLKLITDNIDTEFLSSVIKETPEWEKDITIVDRINALLEIQELSKSDLAKKMGVSRQHVT
ncbi:MAG: hypothetical protein JXA66_05790, partial [Oligoflexia bacterium]|nr:hypothetical protein [Oligoflexia bacterium]